MKHFVPIFGGIESALMLLRSPDGETGTRELLMRVSSGKLVTRHVNTRS